MPIQKVSLEHRGSIQFGTNRNMIASIELKEVILDDGSEYVGSFRTVADPNFKDWTNMYITNPRGEDIVMITVNRQLNVGWVKPRSHNNVIKGNIHVEYTS